MVIKPFSLSSRLVSSTCDSPSPPSWNWAAQTTASGLGQCSHHGSCRPSPTPVSTRAPTASNSSSSVSLPNSSLNASSLLAYPAVLLTRFPLSFAILASYIVHIWWIIWHCQTLPVLPQDCVWYSSRAIYPLADLSPNSSTCWIQKCWDAHAVGGSGHFQNLPVHIVFLIPRSGPCENHIIDIDARPPTSQEMT